MVALSICIRLHPAHFRVSRFLENEKKKNHVSGHPSLVGDPLPAPRLPLPRREGSKVERGPPPGRGVVTIVGGGSNAPAEGARSGESLYNLCHRSSYCPVGSVAAVSGE